jgi:hypothetical protein
MFFNSGGLVNTNIDNESAQRPQVRRRDWRRIHHSPLFWIGLFLCLAAIAIYVMSLDLSWRPQMQKG